jgi:hypothetical protein
MQRLYDERKRPGNRRERGQDEARGREGPERTSAYVSIPSGQVAKSWQAQQVNGLLLS